MTYSLCGHGIPGPISFFVQCKLAAELVHVWVWPSSGWNINHRYWPMGVVTIMVHPNIKYIRCLCHTMLMKYASCTSTISKCHLYIFWWPILTRVVSPRRGGAHRAWVEFHQFDHRDVRQPLLGGATLHRGQENAVGYRGATVAGMDLGKGVRATCEMWDQFPTHRDNYINK